MKAKLRVLSLNREPERDAQEDKLCAGPFISGQEKLQLLQGWGGDCT